MTEAEALDLAAKAAKWSNWDYARQLAERGEIEIIRAHATTLMENAALKAEIERLAHAWEAQHGEKVKEREEARLWFEKAQTWKAENERLNAILSEMNDTDVIAKTMAENERLRNAMVVMDNTVRELEADREAVRAEVARTIEVELSMCAIANVDAPSEWIDGFEFAWKRVKEVLGDTK